MTTGIHHVTAIASDAQKTVQFYSQLLGLRLVKKTVNQDDTQTYHLFFGDTLGHPGMDMTFFIFLPTQQGVQSVGMVTTVSFAVPETALGFWEKRLTEHKIEHSGISERFGKKRITFFDFDNQSLELVGVSKEELEAAAVPWTTPEVSQENAIRSFYSATLTVHDLALIEPILTQVFEYELQETAANRFVYSVPNSHRAHTVEVVVDTAPFGGIPAAGTVHHIAFRAADEAQQLAMRNKVAELGLYPTPVIDRFYFKSVYFRTPAGILFEIATDGPGFTADEAEASLGKKLALPPFLESKRVEIEKKLIPILEV